MQKGSWRWREGEGRKGERKSFCYEVERERERERRSAASEIDCFAELLTGVIVRASSVLVCTKYIFFPLLSFLVFFSCEAVTVETWSTASPSSNLPAIIPFLRLPPDKSPVI